jgi:chromosome segregation ATPase
MEALHDAVKSGEAMSVKLLLHENVEERAAAPPTPQTQEVGPLQSSRMAQLCAQREAAEVAAVQLRAQHEAAEVAAARLRVQQEAAQAVVERLRAERQAAEVAVHQLRAEQEALTAAEAAVAERERRRLQEEVAYFTHRAEEARARLNINGVPRLTSPLPPAPSRHSPSPQRAC